MTSFREGHARASNPGKHGSRDWRVTFNGIPTTHKELLFMFGFTMLAEDRYDRRNEKGRYLLFYYADRLITKRSPEKILEVVEDCDGVVQTKRLA